VVLVEDDQGLLDALVTAFRFRWPDAEVLTATDGETGLWLALKRAPDMVVLDVALPDRNGFDVLADIRRASDVPVIFLSGNRDEMDHVRGLELGADDYLVKPFGHLALLAHIRAVLRRAQPLSEPSGLPQLPIGRLRLDNSRRELIGETARVRLTPIEFKLLSHLARNVGHIVSRSALKRGVWGDAEDATDHQLNVFIGRVRSKMAMTGEPSAIITEHGVGYRVVPARPGDEATSIAVGPACGQRETGPADVLVPQRGTVIAVTPPLSTPTRPASARRGLAPELRRHAY
jgi:two-component system KDP operon response regulator KdpE